MLLVVFSVLSQTRAEGCPYMPPFLLPIFEEGGEPEPRIQLALQKLDDAYSAEMGVGSILSRFIHHASRECLWTKGKCSDIFRMFEWETCVHSWVQGSSSFPKPAHLFLTPSPGLFTSADYTVLLAEQMLGLQHPQVVVAEQDSCFSLTLLAKKNLKNVMLMLVLKNKSVVEEAEGCEEAVQLSSIKFLDARGGLAKIPEDAIDVLVTHPLEMHEWQPKVRAGGVILGARECLSPPLSPLSSSSLADQIIEERQTKELFLAPGGTCWFYREPEEDEME